MDCINRLSVKYRDSSNLRKKLIIISIVLSTILLCVVGNIWATTQISETIYFDEQFQEYDVLYYDVESTQFETIIKEETVKKIAQYCPIGYIDLDTIGKIRCAFADKNYMQDFNYQFLKGNYPEKTNEIALNENALKALGVGNEIGEVVEIEIGNNKLKQIFVISGIIKTDSNKKKLKNCFVSENYMRENKYILNNVFIELNQKKNMKKTCYNLAHKIGITDDKVWLKPEGYSIDALLSIGIMAVVIISLSIVTITNIFSYSILERINNIGLLKAIGMTNTQIKKLLRKEGNYYYGRGTAIGIIAGTIISSVFYAVIRKYSNDTSDIRDIILLGLNSWLYVKVYLLICILNYIAVWIGMYIPYRKVRKISIVNAVHFISDNKIKRNKRKTAKILKKPEIRLAYINLFSNKFKMVFSILSMSLSVAVFIGIATFSNSIDINKILKRQLAGNIAIFNQEEKDNTIKQWVDNLPGKNKEYILKRTIGNVLTKDVKINPQNTKIVNDFQSCKKLNQTMELNLYSYNDNFLNYIIDNHSLYNSKNNDTKFDLNKKVLEDNKNWCIINDRSNISNYNTGDIITINNVELKIVGKFDLLNNVGSLNDFVPAVIVSDYYMANYTKNSVIDTIQVEVDEAYYEEAKILIEKYSNGRAVWVDYIDEREKELKNNYKLMFILMYLMIVFVAFFNLLTLINSIYTSVITRKREFGVLKSIGMTKEQIIRYLRFEGIFYIGYIIIIGIPVGIVLSRAFTKTVEVETSYRFAYWSLIIIAVYYFIIRCITKISARRMERNSVVECIREVG